MYKIILRARSTSRDLLADSDKLPYPGTVKRTRRLPSLEPPLLNHLRSASQQRQLLQRACLVNNHLKRRPALASKMQPHRFSVSLSNNRPQDLAQRQDLAQLRRILHKPLVFSVNQLRNRPRSLASPLSSNLPRVCLVNLQLLLRLLANPSSKQRVYSVLLNLRQPVSVDLVSPRPLRHLRQGLEALANQQRPKPLPLDLAGSDSQQRLKLRRLGLDSVRLRQLKHQQLALADLVSPRQAKYLQPVSLGTPLLNLV